MKEAIKWTGVPQNNSPNQVQCHLCSAIVSTDSREAHQIFHDQFINRNEVRVMSGVAWCDPGSHAFKAGEPGSQSFQGTTRDEEGNPIRIEMDACSLHSFLPPNKEAIPTIEARRDSDN